MMNPKWALSLFFLLVLVSSEVGLAKPPLGSRLTALDEYIAKPDSTYRWEHLNTFQADTLKVSVLKLWSQTWRTEKDMDRPVWEHTVVITIPPKVTSTRGFLLIGGGSHNSKPPTSPDPIAAGIAKSTGSVVAELKNIPNQPLVFHGDGVPRTEDDLIGYSWSQFLDSGDPTWLPRLPMTKSAVRAMDCISEFAISKEGGEHKVEKFIVGGGSKRGWTTWITGAADRRVEAIVPIVIDVLNVDDSLRHHAECYGFWADSIGNYYQHRILQRFDHPRLKDLYSLVDPFSYRDRLTMPKYIVNASGDQFFVPDSSQFYWDELKGEKLLRYVANADHGLKNTDAAQSIATFHYLVSQGIPRPTYLWSFEKDGGIVVTTKSNPSKVVMWQANNPKARDFRLEKIGPAFERTELVPVEPGVYRAPAPSPRPGWTATFIELAFPVEGQYPLMVSTAVRVSPDKKPFEGISPDKVPYESEEKLKSEGK